MRKIMKKIFGLVLIGVLITTNVSANATIKVEPLANMWPEPARLEMSIDPPVVVDPD